MRKMFFKKTLVYNEMIQSIFNLKLSTRERKNSISVRKRRFQYCVGCSNSVLVFYCNFALSFLLLLVNKIS